MCGIFGIAAGEGSGLTGADLKSTVTDLLKLSESRGKEASGVAVSVADSTRVLKSARAASLLVRSPEYNSLFTGQANGNGPSSAIKQSVAVIGHSRLVTTGSLEVHENNQPVISNNIVGIHNGIIVNFEELWKKFPTIER
ncbi:MAG: hypothetical protein V3T30_09325, partial [Thermodesulfobacteriota bacterium]